MHVSSHGCLRDQKIQVDRLDPNLPLPFLRGKPETSNKAPMPYSSQSQASVDGMVNEAKIDAHLAGQAERTCLDHPETPNF